MRGKSKLFRAFSALDGTSTYLIAKRLGEGYKEVAGRTVQVLFKHGEYSLGLQLVVGKLTGFGVLQSYFSATTQSPRSSYVCVLCLGRASSRCSALAFALCAGEVFLVNVKLFGLRNWHVLTDEFYGDEVCGGDGLSILINQYQ
jgi:hypothetical protein